MEAVRTASNLSSFLRFFSETNKMRPTRMGVFEEGCDSPVDYWLEDDLPLAGIDVESHDGGKVSIQILLSNKEGAEKSHYTHVIEDVRFVKYLLGNENQSDLLEISGFDGNTTVLNFENERG